MKVSKDFIIGLIGLGVIVGGIMLVNFIRKSDIFNTDKTIHAVFASATGIEVNNHVLINGLPIGAVTKLQPADKNLTGVKVSFKIDKDLNIPSNSVAHVSPGALSASTIIIEKGNSKTYLEDGDVIKSHTDDMAGNLQAQVKPLEMKIKNITDSLAVALNQFNTKLDNKKQENLRQQIASLNNQMMGYSRMTRDMNINMQQSLNNFEKNSAGYIQKGEDINKTLRNANKQSNELAQRNFQRKVDSINYQISSVRARLGGLTNGPLGKFVNNRDAYNSLSEELTKTELLLDDIRVNPKRYIDISVLGKSSKSPELTESEAEKRRRQQNIEFNRRQQEQYKNR